MSPNRPGSVRGESHVVQPVAALIVMFLLASLGAFLDWSWWLEYAVLIPSVIWLTVCGHLVVYRQLMPGSKDRRPPVLLAGLIMVAGALQPTQFSGLAMAGAFAIVYIFSRDATKRLYASRQAKLPPYGR